MSTRRTLPPSGPYCPSFGARRSSDALFGGGLKRLFTGAVNFRKLAGGLRTLFARRTPESLSNDVAQALLRHRLPAEMILCTGDNTAIAADAEVRTWRYPNLIRATQMIETDSHTFARPGDDQMLLTMVETALQELAGADQAS